MVSVAFKSSNNLSYIQKQLLFLFITFSKHNYNPIFKLCFDFQGFLLAGIILLHPCASNFDSRYSFYNLTHEAEILDPTFFNAHL